MVKQAAQVDVDRRLTEMASQLAQLRQQLLDAQKMSILGELVGTTVHEFNNVLMTILNYAKMGLRHTDDATRTKAFDRILAASQRAAQITQSVLGVAKNRGDQFDRTHLREIVEQTMVLLEREFQKHRIAVEYELDNVPPVRAIGNQIQQVLLNLLINARQAMPDGGRVIIRLRHDAEAGMVELTVRDFGTGIPPHVLPRIFEPRFSTKSGPDATGRGGSGLGLFACHHIVESHGGRIRVESSAGKGASFTVRLPQYRGGERFPTGVPAAVTAAGAGAALPAPSE